MRVTALDAGLPFSEPFSVLLFSVFCFLPQEEIRLCFVRRAKDIRFRHEPFLEERVGCGIDAVDAAIFIIWNPDQEPPGEISIIAEGATSFSEMDGDFFAQEIGIVVADAYRGALDLQIFDEGFDIIDSDLGVEDQMKIYARA